MENIADVADRLDAELGSWWEEVVKTDAAHRVTTPLYHYTDATGLNGIIEKEELWLTSVLHQNDPTEMSRGLPLAIEEFESLRNKTDDRFKGVYAIFGFYLKQGPQEEMPHEFFVSSFSTDGDELGQWRGYGDDGCGYAIGFAPEMFAVTGPLPIAHPRDTLFVQRVAYKDEAVRARLRGMMSKMFALVEREIVAGAVKNAGEEIELIRRLAPTIFVEIVFGSIGIKDCAYLAESETRLVMPLDPKAHAQSILIRTSGSRLLPYVKRPLPIRANMVEIVVGPSAIKERAEHALRLLLNKYGLKENVKISHSKVPYRSKRSS